MTKSIYPALYNRLDLWCGVLNLPTEPFCLHRLTGLRLVDGPFLGSSVEIDPQMSNADHENGSLNRGRRSKF